MSIPMPTRTSDTNRITNKKADSCLMIDRVMLSPKAAKVVASLLRELSRTSIDLDAVCLESWSVQTSSISSVRFGLNFVGGVRGHASSRKIVTAKTLNGKQVSRSNYTLIPRRGS